MDFLVVLGIFDSKQLDVFIYIAENTKSADNIFFGTQRKIANDTGVSLPTVNAIMQKLQKHGFIRRITPGAYMIDPRILMKGNPNKQHLLVSHFCSDEPLLDSLTKPKTKKN